MTTLYITKAHSCKINLWQITLKLTPSLEKIIQKLLSSMHVCNKYIFTFYKMDPIKLSISDYVNILQQNVRKQEYTKHCDEYWCKSWSLKYFLWTLTFKNKFEHAGFLRFACQLGSKVGYNHRVNQASSIYVVVLMCLLIHFLFCLKHLRYHYVAMGLSGG